jgi:hypothetical protein
MDVFANVIKQFAGQYRLKFPFTWQQEILLRRRGKLKVPDGYCRIPAWQQVGTDCSAVAVAAAVQKLFVKAASFFGSDHPILAPHPCWLYAVARNEIAKGRHSIAPGCSTADVIAVIERYGVLWLMEGLPPYTLEVLDAWTDSIHYKKAGISPALYSHYFERFLPIAQKIQGLTITKIPHAAGVFHVLNLGGVVVIESTMPFEPLDMPDKRKLLVYKKRDWGKHTTYITDIDNNFPTSTKKIAVARWQLWGESGEHGEYISQHDDNPSGMGWQLYESVESEFKQHAATAYGFLLKTGD